ncbi:hypothetical protein GCM10023334_000440 [Nonomuraea thailandensis]
MRSARTAPAPVCSARTASPAPRRRRLHGRGRYGGCYTIWCSDNGSLTEIEGGELMTVAETTAVRGARIILTSRASA